MDFRSILVPLLLLLPFQSPADSFRKHYEAAEAQQRAGNYVAAEAEFTAILAEAYDRLGGVYSAQGNYKESVTAFEASASYRPDSVEVLVDLGIAYFHTEQYQKAIEPLSHALAIDPRSAAAHQMLGKTYFMIGEFEKSAHELEIAAKLSPRDYDVAYTLGLAYLKQRQIAPARQIYGRMIEQLGDRPQLRVLIGRAYRETGFLPEGIEEFKKAIALDPHFPRVHFYLGLTYLLKDGADRLSDAEEEFKIELAEHPDEFFANYYLGILSTIGRKWDAAIAFLQKASRIEPTNPDPYFFLGQAYQALEKYDQAIEVLRKAIALNPDLKHNDYQVTNAHFRLGQSLIKSGRTDEGEKEIQIASDLKSKAFKRDEVKIETYVNGAGSNQQKKGNDLVSAEGVVAEAGAPDARTREALKTDAAYYEKVIGTVHNDIGALRAERQDFRAAAEQFALAAKWNPQLDGVNFNRGLASYKAELYKDAIPPLEKEVRDHPTNIPAKQLLGLSYFMIESYAPAASLLTDVVAAKPNEAPLYYPLALSLIKQGKTETADHYIQQMVTMGGSSPQVHILLGQAHSVQGDTAKALDELRTALSIDNKVSLAHFYAGLIYLKTGKFDEAAREFEGELALNPKDLQAKYHLAYVLLAGQHTDRGIKLMREVIQTKPDFGDARFELGKALLQQGDIKGAVDNLESAIRLDPEKPHVHYQLGRAYIAAGRKTEGDSQIEISKQLKEKARGQSN
jgi:tetratricopeptide (TPR) repeat protein